MDFVLKWVMGGWIPEGKRTQTMAAVVALGAILTSVVQWGTGDLSLVNLATVLKEKWEIFAVAYGTYFFAEKVDGKK